MVQGNLLFGAIAGVIGTIVITLLMYGARLVGLRLDIPYLLGTRFVNINDEAKVYVLGFTLHFLAGAVWGAMYILTLTAMGINQNWPAGVLWGFAHGIFIGVMMSTISEQHPYIGEGKPISNPGILGRRWSVYMPYLVLGIHIIFGVITLLSYQLMVSP